MPQPLGKGKGGVEFGSAFEKRPAMALQFANIVSAWSLAEMQLGMLFAALVNHKEAALAILWQQPTSDAKRKLVLAVSEAVLDEAAQAPIASLMARFQSLAKQRNRLVHQQWGTCAHYPDDLVLGDRQATEISERLLMAMIEGAAQNLIDDHLATMMRYTAADFTNLHNQIAQFSTDLSLATATVKIAAFAKLHAPTE